MTASWRIEHRGDGLLLSTTDGHETVVDFSDAPDLVTALLKRGDFVAARTVAAVWFVGLANAAGFDNVTAGP